MKGLSKKESAFRASLLRQSAKVSYEVDRFGRVVVVKSA
jgi:hypothetical protein